MHRLPLADELPYRFHPPRVNPLIVKATRGLRRRMLRNEHRVETIAIDGLERLRPLLDRGDGILLTPNHGDRADGLVLLELGDRLGRPVCAMAAHQIFVGNAGLREWLFPRLGVFPVDREGSDLAAVKAAVEVVVAGKHPLVVFPEGEVYHTSDRITPLREGVAFLAATSAKKAVEAGRTVWIVPIGLKYRFLDDCDPIPAILGLMDRLEARFTWRARAENPLVERIYFYAQALLTLKEIEYRGDCQAGSLVERIASLRGFILEDLEDRHHKKKRDGSIPERVKELRRCCLDRLADETATPETRHEMRRDLNSLFVVTQLYSYPGDYVRDHPTVERVAETLMKFEEDVLGSEVGAPLGPRRAILKIGEPIDVGARLRSGEKLRSLVGSLTDRLESRIQELLDAIGPGRQLPIPSSTGVERLSTIG